MLFAPCMWSALFALCIMLRKHHIFCLFRALFAACCGLHTHLFINKIGAFRAVCCGLYALYLTLHHVSCFSHRISNKLSTSYTVYRAPHTYYIVTEIVADHTICWVSHKHFTNNINALHTCAPHVLHRSAPFHAVCRAFHDFSMCFILYAIRAVCRAPQRRGILDKAALYTPYVLHKLHCTHTISSLRWTLSHHVPSSTHTAH